ncbi:MAG: type II methionyl aminopeptidase [Euryarchaeota archaeon]|nr:type II methionyl aminopeptidase [Euryarchaeota archaeon]
MNEQALRSLRLAGSIAREAREYGIGLVAEGVRYLDVAVEVEEFILRKGARPAFPVNVGVNEVAAHFTPNNGDAQRFARGDVVKLDVGVHVDGFVGDTAATVEIGTRNWQELIDAVNAALRIALEVVGEGVPVSTIGGAIERAIKEKGFRPVVNLTGHSMNQYNLHAGLTVPNIDDGMTTKVRDGMAVAIEPFATNGAGQVVNGKLGNIYRVITERPMRDPKALEFFRQIHTSFGTLPFCERWCVDIDKRAPSMVKTLLRHGLISSYPVLKEMKKGIVSQAEHTVAIHDGKVEITT